MATSDISPSREERKKYTRDELFHVAESMNDSLIDQKQLNEFKKAELIYNLMSVDYVHSFDRINFKPPPELRRTLSNHHNIERNQTSANSHQLQPKIPQRISRMTSSPSLKYNRDHPEERIMLEGDAGAGLISSQARAKYVELIENLKTSSSDGLVQLNQSRRNQTMVSRSKSFNFWQQADEQRSRAPNSLSRYETIDDHRHHQDRCRDSYDEPLSLPYVLTNNNNNNNTTGIGSSGHGKKSVAVKSSISGTLADDLSHEPIRRLGSSAIATVAATAPASSNQKVDNPNNEIGDDDDDDDDDFDLNSMINITVLSDIKTIRQDLIHNHHNHHHHQHQPYQLSNNNRLNKQQSASIRHREHRTQETRPMLTRSRTATEFNYRGRYRHSDSDQVTVASNAPAAGVRVPPLAHTSRILNSSFDSTINQPTGYDSIPCTYSWQYNEPNRQLLNQGQSNQRTRSMAMNTKISENGPIRATTTSKPKDEKAAKIIETFKAQILARAASSSLPDETIKSEEKQESSSSPKGGVMEKPKESKLAKDKLSEKKSTTPMTTDTITTSNEQRLVDVKGTVSKQIELPEITPKKVESPSQKTVPMVISNISNIPRLISLQKKKDEVSMKSVVDLPKPTTTTTTTTTNVGMKTVASGGSSKPLPVSSTKFVSQYRKLRGKSLADELSEQQTSSK